MNTPQWLSERNSDPYGTPPRHPFWTEVEVERVGNWNVFQRDGRWFGYDTKYNAWWKFSDRNDAVEQATRGSVDVWS